MSLVNSFNGGLNKATNFVRNPLSSNITPVLEGDDFPEGFTIQEILSNGQEGESVVLIGNLMPHIPLKFGGKQRFKKDYYSGYSEPTMQVFGPEENDITINGEFKDKKFSDRSFKGVSTELQQQLDAMRIRGNVVRFRLGEMERYALISDSSFEMERLGKVKYSITFAVIGFNAPKNAVFLQRTKEYPFAINTALIAKAADFESMRSSIPSSVPLSIADALNNIISNVASVIASVTGFIDSVINSVQDIRKSIERAKGLVKHVQNKIRGYKKIVGGFSPFDSSQALTGRYENAKFYTAMGSALSGLSAMLNALRLQFASLANNLPLGRHLVKDGDNLQKISLKFYGTADHWKKIYDYNNLVSTQLELGKLLEIPRL